MQTQGSQSAGLPSRDTQNTYVREWNAKNSLSVNLTPLFNWRNYITASESTCVYQKTNLKDGGCNGKYTSARPGPSVIRPFYNLSPTTQFQIHTCNLPYRRQCRTRIPDDPVFIDLVLGTIPTVYSITGNGHSLFLILVGFDEFTSWRRSFTVDRNLLDGVDVLRFCPVSLDLLSTGFACGVGVGVGA